MPVKIKENYSGFVDRMSRKIADPQQLLSKVNTDLKKYIKRAFTTKGRSSGEVWERHSPYTIARRKQKGTYNRSQPILWEYGNLRNVLIAHRIMNINKTGFKTDDYKAITHQTGGVILLGGSRKVSIPSRPVYRVSEDYADKLAKMTSRFLMTEVKIDIT